MDEQLESRSNKLFHKKRKEKKKTKLSKKHQTGEKYLIYINRNMDIFLMQINVDVGFGRFKSKLFGNMMVGVHGNERGKSE